MAEIAHADLDLISTDDLIEELAVRHKEIIVIREHKKDKNADNVFVKTQFGKRAHKGKGFDLLIATQMLQSAHWQLVYDYLGDVQE